jgi:hypothetical protein
MLFIMFVCLRSFIPPMLVTAFVVGSQRWNYVLTTCGGFGTSTFCQPSIEGSQVWLQSLLSVQAIREVILLLGLASAL